MEFDRKDDLHRLIDICDIASWLEENPDEIGLMMRNVEFKNFTYKDQLKGFTASISWDHQIFDFNAADKLSRIGLRTYTCVKFANRSRALITMRSEEWTPLSVAHLMQQGDD